MIFFLCIFWTSASAAIQFILQIHSRILWGSFGGYFSHPMDCSSCSQTLDDYFHFGVEMLCDKIFKFTWLCVRIWSDVLCIRRAPSPLAWQSWNSWISSRFFGYQLELTMEWIEMNGGNSVETAEFRAWLKNTEPCEVKGHPYQRNETPRRWKFLPAKIHFRETEEKQ